MSSPLFSDMLLYYLFNVYIVLVFFFFFFKQKTAYEMRISDWSSDVCSSDLIGGQLRNFEKLFGARAYVDRRKRKLRKLYRNGHRMKSFWRQIGRASCRERVCQYV